MTDKWKTKFNIFLNIVLSIAIIGFAYSWMITAPSEGEIVDYDRDLIITSSDVTAKIYAYVDGEYVEQTTSPMNLGLMEPGERQLYRFDITNDNDNLAATKIVFSEITGDITAVDDFVLFGSTSPDIFEFSMASKLQQSSLDNSYFFNFLDKKDIPGNSTVSIYWYATIDETATVESGITDKGISINHIVFVEP